NKNPMLLVKSEQIVERRHGLSYIFSPSIIAYDDNLNEVGEWLDIDLCYSQGWNREETGYFGIVKLNPEVHGRLIIFTSDKAMGSSTHFGGEAIGSLMSGGVAMIIPVE